MLRYVAKSGEFEVFHRTEPQWKEDEPHFGRFEVPFARACLSNIDTFIKLEIWDFLQDGHILLGTMETTVRELETFTSGGDFATFRLSNSKSLSIAKQLSEPLKDYATLSKKQQRRINSGGPTLSLKAKLHQSNSAPALVATTDQLDLDAGVAAGTGSLQPAAASQNNRTGRHTQRPRHVAPTMKDDAVFLNSLLEDQSFLQSDLKDVIGNGINFINERSSEHAASASQNQRKDLPDGMGTFLEQYSMSNASAAAVDGFRRRRRGGKSGKGGKGGRRSRTSVSPAMNEGSELVGTAANVRQRARSSMAVANAPSTSVRSPSPQSLVSDSSVQHMSVSGAHGKGSKFSGPGKGSLSITMRLQGFENTSLNQPMLHKKPKYRRSTKLKSFEEMAGSDKHQVTQLLIPSRPGFVDLRANYSHRY